MAGKDEAAGVRVEYDRRARDYHHARDLPLDALEPLRRALAAHLTPRSSPLLDVGAGTGRFARAFAEWFALDVVAVEPSAGMRHEARRLNAHPRVSCVAGWAEALPVRGGSCAAAWLSTVIHHVADLRLIEGLVEAEARGDLGIRRVPHDVLAVADHDGHVRRGHAEAVEQALDVGVRVEVQVRVGMPVPGEELADTQRRGAVDRSDEHDVGDTLREQLQHFEPMWAGERFPETGELAVQALLELAMGVSHD